MMATNSYNDGQEGWQEVPDREPQTCAQICMRLEILRNFKQDWIRWDLERALERHTTEDDLRVFEEELAVEQREKSLVNSSPTSISDRELIRMVAKRYVWKEDTDSSCYP